MFQITIRMAIFGKRITLLILFYFGLCFFVGAQSFFWSGEQPKNSADIKEFTFLHADSMGIFTNVETAWTKYGALCHKRQKHTISIVMTFSDAKKIAKLKRKSLILKIKTMLENGNAYILYKDCKGLFPDNLGLISEECKKALESSYEMKINMIPLFSYEGEKILLTKENTYTFMQNNNFLVVVINVFDISRWQPFISYDDKFIHDNWSDYFTPQKTPTYIHLIVPLNSNTF